MAIITRIDLLLNRRTKIVATMGPASANPDTCRALIDAGVNVFRLNMSHGEHDAHRAAFALVRETASAARRAVAVMADLCGPKIRTGRFENGQVTLTAGEQVVVTTRDVLGASGLIPSQYEAFASDVGPGDRVLLADGLMELRVVAVAGSEVTCEVVHGGVLGDHKGINLPGVELSVPSMTEKDRQDAIFAADLGVDYVALSFVRRAEDVALLRECLAGLSTDAQIIAKIEKPEALQNAEAVIEAADGIMVARGDLGVELPPEEVPIAQEQLVLMAREQGKPVIVATQMLESMIQHSRPTRAEVTDVSHAVVSGADAVMLSGETAVGAYPVDAVKIMDRIARQTEAHIWQRGEYGLPVPASEPPIPVWNVIANATSNISRDLMARGVLVISMSGATAITVSSARPAAPVVAITSDENVYRRMALLWGVIPLFDAEAVHAEPNELARQLARDLGLAVSGQYVLLVRGYHDDPEINAPSITVLMV